MASFTVATGSTVTSSKTVSNNDTGTIQAGGTLSDTTDITWTGGIDRARCRHRQCRHHHCDHARHRHLGLVHDRQLQRSSTRPARSSFRQQRRVPHQHRYPDGTITVDNSGIIVSGALDASSTIVAHASGQALDFAAIVSPTAVVNITNQTGALIGASGDDAIRPGAGIITIVNDGLIDATASASRAINLNTTNLANLTSLTLDQPGTRRHPIAGRRGSHHGDHTGSHRDLQCHDRQCRHHPVDGNDGRQ